MPVIPILSNTYLHVANSLPVLLVRSAVVLAIPGTITLFKVFPNIKSFDFIIVFPILILGFGLITTTFVALSSIIKVSLI